MNNREICHAFAHRQGAGKEGSNLSISWNGNSLYSYSTVIAEYKENKHGETCLLIDSYHYSATTAKHQSYLSSALYRESNVRCFCFPKSDTNISTAIGRAVEAWDKQQAARTRDYISEGAEELAKLREYYAFFDYETETVKSMIKNANHDYICGWDMDDPTLATKTRLTNFGLAVYRFMIGAGDAETMYNEYIKTPAAKQHQRVIQERLERGRERRREAEERNRQRRAEQAARRARWIEQEKQQLPELEEQVKEYFAHACNYLNISTAFIQIHGFNAVIREATDGSFETSKGIKLTYDEGKRLWTVIRAMYLKAQAGEDKTPADDEHSAHDRNGVRYLFRSFLAFKDDYLLTAGCHTLSFWNMYQIARLQGWNTEGITGNEEQTKQFAAA